jgi:hypothetical protein
MKLLKVIDDYDALVLDGKKILALEDLYITLQDVEDLIWGELITTVDINEKPQYSRGPNIFKDTCMELGEGAPTEEEKWDLLNKCLAVAKKLPKKK